MNEILLIATLAANGLMAGLYWSFSIAVMPGLRRTDDQTFVSAMQWINRRITNGLFFLAFFGALLLPIAAAILVSGPARIWIIATAALYFASLVSTMGVNVPLNNELDKTGNRAAFEAKWVTWNHIRALLTLASLITSGIALLKF